MAAIRFLNVDLDVRSDRSLRSLTEDLALRGMFNLRTADEEAGEQFACYELDGQASSAHQVLVAMLTILEGMGADAREAWDASTAREFNLGYDCGTEPWAHDDGIGPDVIRRISELGGSLRITLYPEQTRQAKQPNTPTEPEE
jgi:hypothetical protein